MKNSLTYSAEIAAGSSLYKEMRSTLEWLPEYSLNKCNWYVLSIYLSPVPGDVTDTWGSHSSGISRWNHYGVSKNEEQITVF
jgi:hypothetical protein